MHNPNDSQAGPDQDKTLDDTNSPPQRELARDSDPAALSQPDDTVSPWPAADPAPAEAPKTEPQPDAVFEPEPEPEPEPAAPAQTAATPAQTAAAPAPRGGFAAGLLGGLVAFGLIGGAGYGAWRAQLLPGLNSPAASPDLLAAQADKIAALESELRRLATAAAAPSPQPSADLAPLSDQLGQLTTAQEAIATRLAELENRPAALVAEGDATPSAEEVAALRAEIARLNSETESRLAEAAAAAQASIAQAQSEAEALRDQSRLAAEAAEKRAALTHLRAALDTGADPAPALARLQALGQEIAPALQAPVPTLAALVTQFPEAARPALAESLAATATQGTAMDRALAFLQAQTGARALTPQAGSGPDAVLSRAEAATRQGDLAQALSEIAALPAEGQAAMAKWKAGAEARLAADAALADLAAVIE